MPPPAAAGRRQHKSLPAPQQGHTAGGQAHVYMAQTCSNLQCSTPLRGSSFSGLSGSVCLFTDCIRQKQHQTRAGKTFVTGAFKADKKSAVYVSLIKVGLSYRNVV